MPKNCTPKKVKLPSALQEYRGRQTMQRKQQDNPLPCLPALPCQIPKYEKQNKKAVRMHTRNAIKNNDKHLSENRVFQNCMSLVSNTRKIKAFYNQL